MTAQSANGVVTEINSKQVAILVRALKWYANPENWGLDDWNVKGVVNPPDYGDPGKKARTALKKVGIS